MYLYKRPEKDLKNPPGQVVNRQPKITIPSVYLRDEIKRMQDAEKPKLTFEEWYRKYHKDKIDSVNSGDDADSIEFMMKQAWFAAQENK